MAAEEDAAVTTVATTRKFPTTTMGRLWLLRVATMGSSRVSMELSGASTGKPPSNGACKSLVLELNAVASSPPKPLNWSNQVITFDPEDHPDNVVGVGTLPLIVLPIIHNYKVIKMLVDGGSNLNLLTAKVLATLQIPLSRLQDTGVFQGLNGSVVEPRPRNYTERLCNPQAMLHNRRGMGLPLPRNNSIMP